MSRGISLPTFVAWLRDQDKAQQQPRQPNKAATRRRALMKKAEAEVADDMARGLNDKPDTITINPTTEDKER